MIIVKTNLETNAHAIIFSTDLEQSYDKIIKFYKLRFQIKFNFRDTKQYWELDDFMNVKETAVKGTLLEEGTVLGSAAFALLPVAVEAVNLVQGSAIK